MRVDIIPINELSESMKGDWLKFQASNPKLNGPFFHPEIFSVVGQYCPDIYVALLYEGSALAGFLPYRKDPKDLEAQPLRFCNFEAIICSPERHWDIGLILKKMKLKLWNFQAMVNFENMRSKHKDLKAHDSFRIDLTKGLEEYWAFIQTKKIRLKDLNDKKRKLGIIKGPLRFVANCTDIKILHKFMDWKVARHDRDLPWAQLTTKMLEHIFHLKDPLFQGIMPALYAGDELLAVDFHLRYKGYLGGLHRAFNPNFEKFSAGVLLLHELINEHEALGYTILDLGPEVFQYKVEYSNSSIPTIQGKFKADSLKEDVKSIHWLYQCVLPMVQLRRKIITKLTS